MNDDAQRPFDASDLRAALDGGAVPTGWVLRVRVYCDAPRCGRKVGSVYGTPWGAVYGALVPSRFTNVREVPGRVPWPLGLEVAFLDGPPPPSWGEAPSAGAGCRDHGPLRVDLEGLAAAAAAHRAGTTRQPCAVLATRRSMA